MMTSRPVASPAAKVILLRSQHVAVCVVVEDDGDLEGSVAAVSL
jgi:hypothetical protein